MTIQNECYNLGGPGRPKAWGYLEEGRTFQAEGAAAAKGLKQKQACWVGT